MPNKKQLFSYRIFDELGDWFYYFVIVLIVFKTSNDNAIYLGVLSASYTVPGLVFSRLLARTLRKHNIRSSLLSMATIRVFVLVAMFIFVTNTLFVIILVFLEQMLSLGSKLAFQNMIVDIEEDEDVLKSFNRDVTIWSTAARLCVIPIYFLLTKQFSDEIFVLLDAIFMVFALISIGLISNDTSFSKSIVNVKLERSQTVFEKNRFDGLTIWLIVLLSSIGVANAFTDAYGISAINFISNNTKIQYAIAVFVMTIAELISGMTSKLVDNQLSGHKRNYLISIMVLLSGVLMIGAGLFKTMIILLTSLVICRIFFIWIQLYALAYFQQKFKNQIMSVLAVQNMALDGVALGNSIIGGFLINQLGIISYMLMIGVNCIIFGLAFILMRKGN